MGRIAIRKEKLTPLGIPRRYVDIVEDADITYKGKPAKVIKAKAPSKCPHCQHEMHYEHMGCDGDFCFGFMFCPNHQEEVYPTASGPH